MNNFSHPRFSRSLMLLPALVAIGLHGCATVDSASRDTGSVSTARIAVSSNTLRTVDRLTWGINASTMRHVYAVGLPTYIEAQLAANQPLPAAISAQIDAMSIVKQPMPQLVQTMEQVNKDANAIKDDDAKKIAQQAYQSEMNRLAREAATRTLLRDTYSPNQLQEQMVAFWMNHFSVHQGKSNIRAMIGDYEESAIRPHAMGTFRDLVAATVFHPAMIRYLDNEQNAANKINENYARELMELHTLGVGSGYTQHDVQELARILTGVGINLGSTTPNVKKELAAQYVRTGLFEFNPNRHDYGDKVFLGQPLKGSGLAEVNQAIDRLCQSPAAARFVSQKLAMYFASDESPANLVNRMSATFTASDGDIGQVLRTMLNAPEFAASLGHKFKTPLQYVVSAVRLAYDDKPILNTGPMLNWLNRMRQPMYGRQTPDGYPLSEVAWASPGQMATRFEIAKAIGSGSAGLFKPEGPQTLETPAFPKLANALYFAQMESTLSEASRHALEQATSQQEWNMLLMASPELMYR